MADPVVELNIDPENAFYILMKAREFDEKTASTDPDSGSNPSDDADVDILEDVADDPTYEELMAAMDSLNEDELYDLIALAWVGRGDFDISEWNEARKQAAEMSDQHIPRYLSETPLLSDFLEEGLSQAGYDVEDYEINRL